ncbi:MAG: hypothetical protein ACT4P2_07690 [Pseudomonadota bacterium]
MARRGNEVGEKGSPRAGFGILEVLVALFVLALGYVLILGQVRLMLDYVRRANVHLAEIRSLSNRAALLVAADRDRVTTQIKGDELVLGFPGPLDPQRVMVRNFAYGGFEVPLTLGFSPIQLFEINDGGVNRLRLLLPAVPAHK